jgi:hypothetical protein
MDLDIADDGQRACREQAAQIAIALLCRRPHRAVVQHHCGRLVRRCQTRQDARGSR